MAEVDIASLFSNDEGKAKFKKSEDVAFYRRQMQGPRRLYRAVLDSLVLCESGARFELLEAETQTKLLLILSPCKNSSVRITIDELQPFKARYRVKDVITAEPQPERLRVKKKTKDFALLSWAGDLHQARVWTFPFHIQILCEDEVTLTFNPTNKLWFETLQDPKRNISCTTKDSLWKETFRQFVDYKAKGPSSIGADLRLHGFSHVCGLPEHADALQLRDTRDSEPYRLYNLDVYAYEVQSPLGLYGSVPLVIAHSANRTLGVLWLNASETFVNVHHSQAEKDDPVPPVKRRRSQPHTDLHWLSESGVIDCRVLLGPQPKQVFLQYSQLTGFQSLPPLFALGYHQSRFNYEDEADVRAVDEGFDLSEIPYDVLWLDIEHTAGKRYFTWDPELFPKPAELQKHLGNKGRKLVVISDPHIKLDPDWPFFCEARDGGHFVKNREGQVFKGTCWPGESCYLDFSNPTTRSWYSRRFDFQNYKESTDFLFVWNDMNEPSVFDGPEQTLPKDAVHFEGWENRDLHNLYGFYQHMATAEGLITRSGGRHRPFVLSRSFFAGSQRFGAIWTGDNVASWDHLKISIPMLLSLSVAGIGFCGADVGGFVQDPEPELLVRWYQAGSLQPFFRGHSAKDTKRREPWLFGEEVTAAVRVAVHQRYLLLPYWYSLFYRAHTSGEPLLRPLWAEFPEEEDTFAIDHEYMIGGALLVRPITDAGVQQVQVLLPGSEEIWFDVQSLAAHKGGGAMSLPVTMDTVPVFQRGGTILPRATGTGSCTADFQKQPLSLTVALNSQEVAEGELYLDDGFSFDFLDTKEFCLRRFRMDSGILSSRSFSPEGSFDSDIVIESISVMGQKKPSSVAVRASGVEENLAFHYDEAFSILTLKNLNLRAVRDWEVQVHT